MPLANLVVISIILLALELIYFKIATHFNIIDHPNSRSSHIDKTIRGGGIIFVLATLLFFFLYGFQYLYFIFGLVLISIISFLDDLFTLKYSLRLSIHLVAVLLLVLQLGILTFPWYYTVFAIIFIIGTINAYNFMDGINGVTGSYSLLTIGTLYYINRYIIAFTSEDLLVIIALALLVFNFFNFRNKASCFAGDVGSVGIAFIIVFLIGQLVLKCNNFSFVLLLLFYGLDATSTIAFRLIRKENILDAHRSHFYQYMANSLRWPHLRVSGLYFVVQLLINIIVVFFARKSVLLSIMFMLFSATLFFIVRLLIEGRSQLFYRRIKIDNSL